MVYGAGFLLSRLVPYCRLLLSAALAVTARQGLHGHPRRLMDTSRTLYRVRSLTLPGSLLSSGVCVGALAVLAPATCRGSNAQRRWLSYTQRLAPRIDVGQEGSHPRIRYFVGVPPNEAFITRAPSFRIAIEQCDPSDTEQYSGAPSDHLRQMSGQEVTIT